MYKVVLDGISDNMALLVQPGKYVAMNTTCYTIMGYDVIKFVPEAWILQEYKTYNGKISTAYKLITKANNLSHMK